MKNRVILVDESIFTNNIKKLHNSLNDCITNLNNLTNGINKETYKNTLEDLKTINQVLRKLSYKKFEVAKSFQLQLLISKSNQD